MKSTAYSFAFVAVVLVAVGCSKQQQQPQPGMATTTGATVTNEDAVTRLTTARCDREQNCNNIGSGKKYADRAACTRETTQNTRGTVRTDECPGIDEAKLSQCLNDIRNERCGNPLDSIETLNDCSRSKLCMSK